MRHRPELGITEESQQSAAEEQVAKFDNVLREAVAARCTVLAASGDWGTANTDKQGRIYPFPTVYWPASDPLVTACGGTQLQWQWRWSPAVIPQEFMAAWAQLGDFWQALQVTGFLDYTAGPGRTEAVWNEVATSGGGPMATGGGLSSLFPTPAFQSGLPQGLLQGRRGVPDISWNAAMNGGVFVHVGDWTGNVDGWVAVAGTSASAPQLAGVIALANQLRSEQGKPPIGYLNPVLYDLPAEDFYDIVPEAFGPVPVILGHNALFGSGIPGFETAPGYDLTTGLGSPRAYGFVYDLADLAL